MEAIMEKIFERLGVLEERSIQTERSAIARYETILERLERMEHAIHGNGEPGIARRVLHLEEWRLRIEGMKAGGVLVLSAFATAVGFIISGGLKALLAFITTDKR